MDSADTSELFFEDVSLPTENLLGPEEGQGFVQLMKELPQERMIVAVHACAMMERALALTDRLRQAAHRVRQEDHRVPEQPVRARRLQDRGDHRQDVLRPVRRAAAQGRARHRDRLDGEILDHRHARPRGRPLPATVRRLRLHGRISDLAPLPRRPRHAHLCGDERDHEVADREKLCKHHPALERDAL